MLISFDSQLFSAFIDIDNAKIRFFVYDVSSGSSVAKTGLITDGSLNKDEVQILARLFASAITCAQYVTPAEVLDSRKNKLELTTPSSCVRHTWVDNESIPESVSALHKYIVKMATSGKDRIGLKHVN